MNIDIHAHFMSKEHSDRARKLGILQNAAYIERLGDILYNPERRIKEMDATEIDIQVVSPVPFLYYEVEPKLGLSLCQGQNDGIARLVEVNPDRFVGMGMVPLQNVDLALQELERTIKELGFRGVEIGSNVAGKDLDAPDLRPFFAAVEKLDIPVFIHPVDVAGADRMKDYYLANIVGNPLDTTLAAARLVFGQVLEQFPRLKVILAHAGGNLPYIRGRWEHGWEYHKELTPAISKPPSAYISRFYYDTIAHNTEALAYLATSMGTDKVLLGTDYPFDMADFHPVDTVEQLDMLPSKMLGQILGGNAIDLFKLE